MENDLKKAYDMIQAKRPKLDMFSNYYSGRQPVMYLTKRLREVFKGIDQVFTENWCSVVIDSVDERLNMTGFESDIVPVHAALKAAWERNQIALEASDVHSDALVLGEAYAVIWPGADGKAELFYNDPRLMHCLYQDANPRLMTMAAKLWTGDDGKAKLTLYYPDRLEYYTSTEKSENVSSAAAFQPDLSVSATGTAPNPYGIVPVFHFKINRKCQSDLTNVIPLQNGINKLLADMMVAAEYGAYNQRWVISGGGTLGLKNAPGEVWDLAAGDGAAQNTQVGQFESTDLKNYLDAIDRLSMAIGVISRTPKHYFFGQGGDPSGEALIALEAPLNKKAQDRIDRFYPVWQQVGIFICQIEGIAVTGENVSPQFEKPSTIQPRTQAEIIKLMVDSTMPLDTALTVAGWTEGEIETMNQIKDEAASKAQESMAGALAKAEQQMKTLPMPPGVVQSTNGVKQNGR